MNRLHTVFSLGILASTLLAGCQPTSTAGTDLGGDTITTHARLLVLTENGRAAVATVKNPWDTAATMATYLLVPRDYPADSLALLPKGTTVRTPLASSLVYSGVHGGIIAEMGALDAVTSVTDGQYFNYPAIRQAIASGKIIDVGSDKAPSIERIVEHSPEAIVTSPYRNSGHGAIEKLGIPIIEMADYMEATPLGRAEWIKFIGRLYGRAAQADSIFDRVAADYTSLRTQAALSSTRPLVLTEQAYNGVWAVPGGASYMATMLADAAVDYPWADDTSTGSIELDPAAVLAKTENADFWLIKSFGPLTLADIVANNPISKNFKCVAEGNVYVCNTSESPLFEEFPFHPEKLLREYINLFHPDLSSLSTPAPRYFLKTD